MNDLLRLINGITNIHKYMKNRTVLSFIFFSALLLFLLSSCDKNRFFEQNSEIKDEKWSSNHKKAFQVNISDTISLFNFYLNIRNTNDYPYANLYVFIQTVFPDSSLAQDTLELQLANVEGRWLGKGNGKYKYSHFILRRAMHFAQMGNYTFNIEQGMRRDTLIGISDVGIRLEYYP